jgi:Tfp pilus assembly protein PilO
VETGTNINGRRWYDSAKVIWGLFGVVGVCAIAFAGTLWASVGELRATTAEHESRMRVMDAEARQTRMMLDRLEAKLDRMDAKLDSMKKP